MTEHIGTSKISPKGQLTVPKEVQDYMEIGPGEKIYWFKGNKERQVIIVREVKIG